MKEVQAMAALGDSINFFFPFAFSCICGEGCNKSSMSFQVLMRILFGISHLGLRMSNFIFRWNYVITVYL